VRDFPDLVFPRPGKPDPENPDLENIPNYGFIPKYVSKFTVE
jgi:hypothetical protein